MRIALIGMGLIGTSLGMALRSADETTSPLGNLFITGYDINAHATSIARGRLAIDREASSLGAAVEDAQLVVICTPAQVTRTVLSQLAPLLAPGAVVTDVASTKTAICRWADEFLPNTKLFVGGHPMAGREQSGPEAADRHLFTGAIYCLTPSVNTHPDAINLVEALVKTIGAKPYYIDPEEHDAYVAGISHLPFLLSAALVEVVSRSPAWQEMSVLAASGFRDMSRLAAGDVVMHRDICLTNREALIRWINETLAYLIEMRDALDAHDAAMINELFIHAKEVRDAWMLHKPSLRPGEEVFQGVPVERRGLFGFGKRRETDGT